MENYNLKNKGRIYILSCILPVILIFISWGINGFFPFGPKSVMAIDFNQQFIDMFVFFKNSLLSGDFRSLFYSFTKSIGGNMVGIWSYYLNSPLNLLYALIPLKFINHTTNIIILIRYGLMGLTFTHFIIKRNNGLKYNRILLLIVSTVYALNGYNVSYQVVPIFYDAMWLLPLVLIGVEEVLDGDKPFKYIIMLAITVFIQFYMGFMICIFVVLYSIFYLLSKKPENTEWKDYLKVMFMKEVKLALSSILSIGLISFMFIPNLYNLIFSKATSTGALKFEWKLQINPLDILGKLYVGAFDNNGWSAGPNLPNIYVGSLVLVGLIMYFTNKKFSLRSKIGAFFVIFIFFISIVNEFFSKLWHMGQNPAGFFYRFSWLIPFFFCLLAYLALREEDGISISYFLKWALGILISTIIVSNAKHSFLNNWQILGSVAFIVIVLIILYNNRLKYRYLILLIITIIELVVNATISQSKIVYNNAYKFTNAIDVIGEAINKIKPGKDDFYRISKTFYRSKDDPMMLDYPGLTHFSSNLEEETRNLFDNTGNNSVDATTFYVGTPLTDALFSVKYLITNSDYKTKDQKIIDKTYFFPEDVSRLDIIKPENLIDKTERFFIYEIKNILPVAFGISKDMLNVKVEKDNPVKLQNEIGKALSNTGNEIFKQVHASKIVLTDMTVVKKGESKFKLGNVQEGKITYKVTPTTDEPLYVVIPKHLSDYKGEVSFFINNQPVKMRKKYSSDQLVNIADMAKGKEQSFEIRIKRKDDINMSRLKFFSADKNEVNQIVEKKKKEGIDVTSWGSNFIKGNINVDQNSNYVFTSIMYDKGWKVRVDGRKVTPIKVLDSLMAFPVLPGTHTIEMEYLPPGFLLGLILSIFSIALFIIYFKKNNIKQSNGEIKQESLNIISNKEHLKKVIK